MTLLCHFSHLTCSINWLVMICLGIVSYNQYALLGHSQIVINFFHSWMIMFLQANNFKTRKHNLEEYIAPFPWLIIVNIPNCFVKNLLLGMLMNYADDMLDWRTFRIHKSLWIPVEYPEIQVSFPLKRPMFLLWKY